MPDTQLLLMLYIARKHDTKDGSALRGTRASILRSDVESGVPGGYPRVEHEAWPGIPSPCRKSSRRGDGVTPIVSLCSLPRAPNSRAVWIFDPRGLWPDSTNHHVGVSGCSASYTSAGA